MSVETKSFWDLPVGASFFTTWNDFTKKKMPFKKVSETEFSRPFGKRKWIMFRPNPPLQPVQMVVPILADTPKPKSEHVCSCGANATGRVNGGEWRCCATCAFHPLGCRCQFGEPKDTANEPFSKP